MNRMGIRARALVIACIACVPLIVLSLYRAHEEERKAVERARHEALLISRVEAALLADRLNQMKDLLSGLAAGLVFERSLAADGCSGPLKRLMADRRFKFNVALVDADGNLRCADRPLAQSINVAERNYLRRAIETKSFADGQFLAGRVGNQQILVSAQPLLDQTGAIRALLVAAIDPNTLTQSFHEAATTTGTVVSLLDLNGTLIARYPDVPEYRGKRLPGLPEEAMLRNAREGFFDYTGLGGVERIGAYSRLRGDEWPLQVVVGIPRARVEQGPRKALLEELGVMALVLACALAVSLVGSQQLITGPLMRLSKAAERYDDGDLSARSGLDHEAGEIGLLARSFDRLAEHNQRKTRALKALSAGNRTLLREKAEDALLAAMCRVAVEEAGYRVAFVNYAEDNESRSVRTVARAGDDSGFVDLLNLTWADEERGRGSVGTAIRTGKVNVVRSMASEPRFAPWREAAIARRLGSVASFPLRVEDDIIGTFTLIAEEEDAFDEDEVELLDEMAADLSFGIETIRAAAKRKEAEALARRALTYDSLVDLPNRSTFIRMVMAGMDDVRRGGPGLAVLAVHVGRLQDIFDSFGYEAYCVLLKEIATRLAAVPACHGALARLPMEDFGVLVPSRDMNIVGVIADRLLERFNAQFSVGDVKLDVRAAVGVSLFPEHGEDGESLIRRASLGAREAFRKDLPFQVYSGAGEREKPERLALAGDLRSAIDADQLKLHYQPKVRIADGAVVGYEALVRWYHPSKGPVPPVSFIPLAEHMGLIGMMTNNVVRMAVRQLREWSTKGTSLPIAVNVSARNLYDPLLVTLVERWLKSYDAPAHLLQFEITESALVEEPEVARNTLQQLRALGSAVYIDDFGTGYSSLSYLAKLPVSSLKIDRSFIAQMGDSREAYSIVASIISMAHSLNLGVVAEGVETAEQLKALRHLGCDEAQGYFFAKPVPPEEILNASGKPT